MISVFETDSTLTQPQSTTDADGRNSTGSLNLCEWLGTSQVISLVLEAVQALYWTSHEEGASGIESRHPQLILGVLTYSYATGLYSADEIARLMAMDRALSYLSLNNQFPRRRLCLFRSQNRELLRHCLSRVFRRAWEIRFNGGFSCAAANSRLDTAFRNYFDAEAGDRINRALRADYHNTDRLESVEQICA